MRSRPHRPYFRRSAPALALLITIGAGLAACDPPPEPAWRASPAGMRGEAGSPPRAERAPDLAGRPGDAAGAPAPPALGEGAGPVVHRVGFSGARNHYIDVESTFPTGGRPSIEVAMAVWTPGSYLVREFSRNVETVTARDADGRVLAAGKTRKNRWRVDTGGAARVTLRYRVYAAELSVRTSWAVDDLAVVNGATLFMAPVGGAAADHDVTFLMPAGWHASVTSLPAHPDGRAHHYLAPDLDTLLDSPVLLGNPVVRLLEVGGVRHRLAFLGDTSMWDADRAARDADRVIEVQRAMWGALPYRSYDFLAVLVDGVRGGGLEHLSSTVVIASPWAMRRSKDYDRWLSLLSHELFHAWNGKRLRPAELGPFDYENEVYTRSLWWAEGVTEYYDALLVRRSGLTDRARYLAALSAQIHEVESTPGREVQSLSLASFDAWIKKYRPDENSTNSSIDYYTKGAVVGFLLDAEIRRATDGKRSLDDVLRAAYRRFAGTRGYTPDELRAIAEEVSGTDLAAFWLDHVDGTAPLDYGPALDYYGLRFGSAEPAGDEAPGNLGLDTKLDAGRLVVSKVVRGGPGWTAGVVAGDEILALDDRRIPADGLDGALGRYRPGDRAELLVSRFAVLRRLPVVLGEGAAQKDEHELEVAAGATAAQRARLDAWLGAAEYAPGGPSR